LRAAILDTLRRRPALYERLRSIYEWSRPARRFVGWLPETVLLRRDGKADAAERDAVVFSSYVPTGEAFAVANEFLDVFKERFADCDFFVGINTHSLPEWELALKASGLCVKYGRVDPRLTVDSDASGFQQALELMRDEHREYRIVWFGHTKGATTGKASERRRLIEDFFLERKHIARAFEHPRVGSYGHDVSVSTTLAKIDARMNRLFPFPYTGIGTFHLHTFYALRGSIVRGFLDGCSEDFFTENLVEDLGFDRYFFERDFSRLADKFGYYPLYRTRHQHMSEVPVTRKVVRALYRDWERQLPHHERARVFFH
jgi:hypothetical protein